MQTLTKRLVALVVLFAPMFQTARLVDREMSR